MIKETKVFHFFDHHLGFIRGVLFFTTLFLILFISASYLQKQMSDTHDDISDNKLLQLSSRNIDNDFRNITIDYFINITHQLDEQEKKIENLENKL